jgi:histone acetyltransferase (RNA polymerase elongator complex component)
MLEQQLAARLPESGGGEIAFYGGSFTLLPDKTQEAYLDTASAFVACGQARGIRFSTRPDGLKPHHLQRLNGYPVTTVEVGCQSFSDQVLRASGRGYDVLTMSAGIERLREAGSWRLGLQLMPGLPAGTIQEAVDTLRAALRLAPDFLRIYPTLVLADTKLEGLYRSGRYAPLTLGQAVALVARMSVVAEHSGVPVERAGLQGDSGWLDGTGDLVAGPYHPAFGQLVRSELWLQLFDHLLQTDSRSGDILVPMRSLGDARGHRCGNLDQLQVRFGAARIRGSRDLPEENFAVNDRVYCRREVLAAIYQDDLHEIAS